MKRHFFSHFQGICSLVAILLTGVASLSATESAAMHQAIDLAVNHSLQLREAEARIQMKLAECQQAGLLPNPGLFLGFDEIRCSDHRSVLGRLQTALGITQLIELGSKRSARQNVVAAEASIVMWEWETIKEELIKKVTDVFIDAYALQAKIKLFDQALENSLKLTVCLTEQIEQGKGSVLLQKRSRLAQHAIINDQKRAEAELAAIKRQLVLLCGQNVPLNFIYNCDIKDKTAEFVNLHPSLFVHAPLPLATYLSLVPGNAELSQLSAVQLAAYYNYLLQKANAVPDMEVTAGIEHDSPHGGCRLLFGFGFELPIYNRNQGNISRANWENYAALYKHEDLEREMVARCRNLYGEFQRSYESIELLHRELMPLAQEMLKIHGERQLHGKEDCLEALMTYRELFDVQSQYIDAVKEFHHLKASLRLLCGEDF